MEFLGLHFAIWITLAMYFAGMLAMGWWCRRGVSSQEGYLLGNRRFGTAMMVMHAFGAGTNPGDAAGVASKTVSAGASGIWVSWMWLFGTPFYWLIAPVIRRMRCLTMADYFQQRFGKAASVLYVVMATVGMSVCLATVLLATTRTVQGMMGKAGLHTSAQASEIWFFGILIVTTVTFTLYGYWGGIIAAIRTDMIQGLMIIVLSFLAIGPALNLAEVGGLAGMRQTLSAAEQNADYLNLFDPKTFNIWTVVLLCVNAPLTALALPHLVSLCAAGKTEWEGRMGITGGNILKRICTIGWCVLGLCWLAYLINTGSEIHPDAAFGDAIRVLLPSPLQGVMLSCVLAAAMSSGDAFQVTVAGLWSENIYRVYFNPEADERKLVQVTRVTGVAVVLISLLLAILLRKSMVTAILDYFTILGLVGISVAVGILWRRMNSAGMFCSTILALITFIMFRYVIETSAQNARMLITGAPIAAGLLGAVIGSLVTKPPDPKVIEQFFRKIYVPVGQEQRLQLPLDQAVPEHMRLLTAGGLFIIKPSRQSWVGFLMTLGICIVCVLTVLAMLKT